MASLDRDEAFEPGSDLHEWESRWASIAEDLEGDGGAALGQAADLVEEMLQASGYEVRDPVARQGEEPEIVVTYLSARDVAERAEIGAASRSEIELAIEDLRDVFRSLTADSAAAGE